MSLLREIQNDAVNSNVKVSDLLRKCKILAYRLGNTDFKNWVEYELNGYPKNLDELPEYRIFNNVTSKGHFSGAFGSGLRNADIPSNCFHKDFRKDLTMVTLTVPIAEIESLVMGSKKGKMLEQPWGANFVAMFSNKIYKHMVCVQAWKVIPSTKLEGVVDIVKTKILNFVLEIEVINPEAGEAKSNSIPQEQVSQIFNINISGNVGNLASGNNQSTINQETQNSQIPIEFIDLLNNLKNSHLNDEIILEVEKRIEALGNSIGQKEYSNNYKELMSFASNHVTVLTFLATYIPMLGIYL